MKFWFEFPPSDNATMAKTRGKNREMADFYGEDWNTNANPETRSLWCDLARLWLWNGPEQSLWRIEDEADLRTSASAHAFTRD